MKTLIPTPAESPLRALTAAAVVPEHFRLDSWGEVRSAEAAGDWYALSLVAWRYLWTARPESEVHHLATTLLKGAPLSHQPGVLTADGRVLRHRWSPEPRNEVRGLILDARLGWGILTEEAALARAENLAWLDEVQRQLRGHRADWSHAWTHNFRPEEADLLGRLERMTAEMEGLPLGSDPSEEAALLQLALRSAWELAPAQRPDRFDFAAGQRSTPYRTFRADLRGAVPDHRQAPWARYGLCAHTGQFGSALAVRYLALMRGSS